LNRRDERILKTKFRIDGVDWEKSSFCISHDEANKVGAGKSQNNKKGEKDCLVKKKGTNY